jgi:fatty-acyl-CoA synthase
MSSVVPPAMNHAGSVSDAEAALWAPLDEDRGTGPFLETWNGSEFVSATWDEWRTAVLRVNGALTVRGIRPGTRVGVLLSNDFATAAALVGAWMAGATVLSLPLMARGTEPDAYAALLRKLCRDADVDLVLAESSYAPMLKAIDLPAHVTPSNALLDGPARDPELPADDDVIFVQYSSGSTSDPKGCALTAAAIGAQLVRLSEVLAAEPADRTVSWLPLSHDMGLFGCLMLTWYRGNRLRMGTPSRFLRRPRTWMEDCAEFGATLSPAPSFALDLAARAAKGVPPDGTLRLRSVILGGERNEQSTIDLAIESLGPVGLTREAITPAYGLAEGVLAVTMKPNGTVQVTLEVAREELLDGGQGMARLVSCGVPLRDVQLTCGNGGTAVGPIRMSTPSMATGYLGNPDATASSFRDGELWTEDLGFMRDGQLYVIGRQDDVICVAGRNVHARDIEMRLTPEIGVRAGNAVVVALDEAPRPELVALVEPTLDAGDLREVARAVARTAQDADPSPTKARKALRSTSTGSDRPSFLGLSGPSTIRFAAAPAASTTTP